jgi:hypothetical protein
LIINPKQKATWLSALFRPDEWPILPDDDSLVLRPLDDFALSSFRLQEGKLEVCLHKIVCKITLISTGCHLNRENIAIDIVVKMRKTKKARAKRDIAIDTDTRAKPMGMQRQ